MKVLLFANTDWYLFNFRRSFALALRAAGHDVLLVSPEGEYGQKLRAMGLEWLPVPMIRRSLNPIRELGLVVWLRQLMLREKVDLVHGFTIKCAVYGSIAAQLAGVNARVASVAGMGYVFTSRNFKARLLRPVVSASLRIALRGERVRVILQNPDDLDLCANVRVVNRDRVRLIPGSGVDTERFSPRNAEVRGPRFRVLLAARLLWDKGIAEYIQAAREVRAGTNDIEFLLAGHPDPGNPASVPEASLRAWIDEGLITWLGHVDDMPSLLHSVDAAVLPSYREGLPKGLIEAAASGLPIITTDAPGCREVVTHELDGLLVPVRDGTAIAKAIQRLRSDRELCCRLAAAAREKAIRQFDEQLIFQQTINVYGELLPGHFASTHPALAATE